MWVEVVAADGRRSETEAARVLIRGNQGTPMVLAIDVGNGAVAYSGIDGKFEFDRMLAEFGISGGTRVRTLEMSPLDRIRFQVPR